MFIMLANFNEKELLAKITVSSVIMLKIMLV